MLTNEKKVKSDSYICNVTKKSYRNSLILIVVTAIVLISAQVYFTIQSYEVNKQRFIKNVQAALDASIENYFAGKAKNSIFVMSESSRDTMISGNRSISSISLVKNLDSVLRTATDSISSFGSGFTHIWTNTDSEHDSSSVDSILDVVNRRSIKRLKFSANGMDSVRAKEFQFLTQKVMLSISEDLIDLGALYEEFVKELENKDLDIEFALNQNISGRKTSIGTIDDANYLSANANSTYLGASNSIGVDFENATLTILKNGIRELILSVLLIGLVIGTLIHLYKTIYAQKQLAAIKDDLISNITHEFKTPIATIFSALEGVTSFNESNDQEKTRRYLALSTEQLQKLNNMVEKMLETATIDQGKLTLNREEVEVVSWTEELASRFRLIARDKKINFESAVTNQVSSFDRFHLENAISNLIDNAIKYGGNEITIRLNADGENTTWEVEDNGGNIPVAQRDKIFDKLYRIPTGNQHDVKGFGIGLYYARTVTELHGGELTLDVSKSKTIFKLKL